MLMHNDAEGISHMNKHIFKTSDQFSFCSNIRLTSAALFDSSMSDWLLRWCVCASLLIEWLKTMAYARAVHPKKKTIHSLCHFPHSISLGVPIFLFLSHSRPMFDRTQCVHNSFFLLIVSLLMFKNRFNWINRVFNFSSRSVYGNCGIGCSSFTFSRTVVIRFVTAVIFVWMHTAQYSAYCVCAPST